MLVKIGSLSWFHIGVISLITLVSLPAIGGILERKRWALFVEPIRMVILVLGAYALSGEMNITLGALLLGAVSMMWFLNHRNVFASIQEINPVQEILKRTA